LHGRHDYSGLGAAAKGRDGLGKQAKGVQYRDVRDGARDRAVVSEEKVRFAWAANELVIAVGSVADQVEVRRDGEVLGGPRRDTGLGGAEQDLAGAAAGGLEEAVLRVPRSAPGRPLGVRGVDGRLRGLSR